VAKATAPAKYIHHVIEVPRAALMEAATMSWPDPVAMAAGAGWRCETTEATGWCRRDHALLRQGLDEMRGIPVLLYQNW